MLTAELATARQHAEALMTDTCTVTRPGEPGPMDEDTGQYPEVTPVVVYTGRCRVKVAQVAVAEAESGGARAVLQRLELHLPVVGSESVRVDQTVAVDTCPGDAALVGRRFRVAGLHHESHATARRLEIVERAG